MTTEDTDRDITAALLTAAGVTVPDDEIDRLGGLYGGLRRTMERFHAVDVGDEVPAAIFRAGDVEADV